EAGFPFGAIERFQEVSGLALGSIAGLVLIPERTLARRRATGKLSPDESERLLRIATVFEKGVDLFEGDLVSARRWLSTPKKALGALEMLVHLEAADALKHYQMCPVTFSGALVEDLDAAMLPANWRKDPPPAKLRAIGDQWIESGRSLVLRVPSAIVAAEHNF